MQTTNPACLVSTRRIRRNANRRGITLLFVISMIVLFLLMGTTFVIVSTDYLRNARCRGRMNIQRDPGPVLLDRTFYDLIRGPELSNTTSPLRGHSILADQYGYGMCAEVDTVATHASGHFITLTLDQATVETILPQDATGTTSVEITGAGGAALSINPVPGLWNGLLLSFVSGNAVGLTTRIIEHQIIGTAATQYDHTFILQPVWSDSGIIVANIVADDLVVINGRPFSGAGAGFYQPNTAYDQPKLGASVAGRIPSSLQPNQRNRTQNDLLFGQLGVADGYLARQGPTILANSTGPAESYDAVDFQNMFLAAINGNGTIVNNNASFHRPELINYVTAARYPASTLTERGRTDFRAFTSQGIVVDNDADGTVDGIWIDSGLPIQTDASGRYFKPLISCLITDLDGKFNVAANGDLIDIRADRFMTDLALIGTPSPPVNTRNRGSGYGPPEVNMTSFFGLGTATNLLQGNLQYNGRYGADDLPGTAVRDAWSEYKLFGYPNAAFAATPPGTVGNHFFSAMDAHGRFAWGYPRIYDDKVDNTFPVGMPVADVLNSALTTEMINTAYEMNFSPSPFAARDIAGVDQPYSPEELERVLRMFDRDAFMLPQRLFDLGGGIGQWGTATTRRQSVTTDSWEVPTTFDNLPSTLYSILDSVVPSTQPNRDQYLRVEIHEMLPQEIFAGLPMDINRPFGDGTDNDGNGVIDDAGEVAVESLTHPNGIPYGLDLVDDTTNTTNSDAIYARAVFARHLYLITLLTTEMVDRDADGRIFEPAGSTTLDPGDWFDFNNDGAVNAADRVDYRRVVAQWAINAVDFRDPDSIMTPFEVDLNPWDGWNVDGNLTTNEGIPSRYVYWGCERPDLLITETFASHDRRTQDTNLERQGNNGQGQGQGAIGTTTTFPPGNPDEDFDSNLVPNVSAFFELYNPWVQNAANQIHPAETSNPARTGVFLQKTVPGTTDQPVFRLIVTEFDPENIDLNDANRNAGVLPPVSRRIYFRAPAAAIDAGPEVYYPAPGITVGPVLPGRYAVVGSAGVSQVGNRYDTYFGRTTTLAWPNGQGETEIQELQNSTRRISLNPTASEVEIVNWDGAAMSTTTRTDVVALPIGLNNGAPRNLGISDPLWGYDPATPAPGLDDPNIRLEPTKDGAKYVENGGPFDGNDYYYDEPVDLLLQPTEYQNALKDDGIEWNPTFPLAAGLSAYRSVYLQRLANPMIAYDAVTNPYITIDYNSVDVFRFNGADSGNDPNNNPQTMRFGSLERRSNENTAQQNQQSAEFGPQSLSNVIQV